MKKLRVVIAVVDSKVYILVPEDASEIKRILEERCIKAHPHLVIQEEVD